MASKLNEEQQKRQKELIDLEHSGDITAEQRIELAEINRIQAGIKETQEEIQAGLKENIELLEEHIELLEAQKKPLEAIVGLEERKIKLQEEKLRLARLELLERKKKGNLSASAIAEEMRGIKLAERYVEEQRRGHNEAESFAARWAGISRDPKHDFTKLIASPGFAKGLVGGLKEVVDPLSVMTSTLDKAVEATMALVFEQDQAVVNFRKSTGASGEFDDNIRGLERSLFTAGVTSAEAGESIQTLFLNVSDFTEMSKNQQKELAENVAVLSELGVSAQTSAKNIQFATKVLGMNTKQATGLQRELLVFAQDLGVSVDQVAGDFETMGPLIAALGDNGVDAFRKLEVQAKNTGLAMADLLALTKKFDTFDGAADSVGKLNALLGGPYLNTLELVAETDPSKRFEILKERVDMAGKSFDDMEYYERKALATAIGLNEQQLALMMQGDIDLIREPKKSQAELAELAKQTAQFNTLMEELGQIAKGLAVSFGPLVSLFKTALQKISPLVKLLPVFLPGIIFVTIAFAHMAASTAKATLASIGHTAALVTETLVQTGAAAAAVEKAAVTEAGAMVTKQATNAENLHAAAVTRTTGATRLAIPAVTGLTSVLLPFVGITAAAVASYFVFTELMGLTQERAMLAAVGIGVVTAALWLMATSVIAATGGFALLTAGLAMVVTGIYVGFSPSVLAALGALTIAFFLLAPAVWALMPVLLPLALAISAVAIAAVGLAAAFTTIFGEGMITNLQLMSVEIANIIASINELSATKAMAFTATMLATSTTAAAVAVTSPGKLSASVASAATSASPVSSPSASGGNLGPPPTINVNLSIDGKEFATVVNNVEVSKYGGPNTAPSTMYDSVIKMIEQGLIQDV